MWITTIWMFRTNGNLQLFSIKIWNMFPLVSTPISYISPFHISLSDQFDDSNRTTFANIGGIRIISWQVPANDLEINSSIATQLFLIFSAHVLWTSLLRRQFPGKVLVRWSENAKEPTETRFMPVTLDNNFRICQLLAKICVSISESVQRRLADVFRDCGNFDSQSLSTLVWICTSSNALQLLLPYRKCFNGNWWRAVRVL